MRTRCTPSSSSDLPRRPGSARLALVSVCVGLAALASGCEPDPLADALAPIDCTTCHGRADLGNAAPPVSANDDEATDQRGVGAHQAHLADGRIRQAIACNACHVVPVRVDAPDHVDPWPAEVVFGELATVGQSLAKWNADAGLTCTDVYCHGATLTGGQHTAPVWTVVDGSQATCDACHGAPPPPPHPTLSNCDTCHPQTVAPDGSIDVAGGLHINGIVDRTQACSGCHGSAANPAPPTATDGGTDATRVTVGAHQAHLTGGRLASAVRCTECHVVPTTSEEAGHLDAPPAELTWGSLASHDDASPEWRRDSATCAGTYCHGATLTGGTLTEPVWTSVSGEAAACGACHGLPPDLPHPPMTRCPTCHPGTVLPGMQLDLDGGLHLNGTVEAQLPDACDACHAAPPPTGSHLAHYGATAMDASYGGVGASADLLPDGSGYAFDCGHCHPLDVARHLNGVTNAGGGDAEVELSPAGAPAGSLRALNAAGAVYTPGTTVFTDDAGMRYTEGTCSGVYCHSLLQVDVPGPVPRPGADFPFVDYPIVYPPFAVDVTRDYPDTPSWGGSQSSCHSCHGFPPRTFSPKVEAGAGDSHSWIDANGDEELHGWNHGSWPLPCATCHNATVQDPGVVWRDPVSLWSVYEDLPVTNVLNHVNGRADVAFTADLVTTLTPQDLSGARYDAATRSCADVVCHDQNNPVVWGTPYRFSNTAECNVCHHK